MNSKAGESSIGSRNMATPPGAITLWASLTAAVKSTFERWCNDRIEELIVQPEIRDVGFYERRRHAIQLCHRLRGGDEVWADVDADDRRALLRQPHRLGTPPAAKLKDAFATEVAWSAPDLRFEVTVARRRSVYDIGCWIAADGAKCLQALTVPSRLVLGFLARGLVPT
jgi:hypothetical protein